MAVTVVVLRERAANERRVALSPDVAKRLGKLGASVLIETGAGTGANQPDSVFPGVDVAADAASALARADVLLCVQPPTLETIAALREGAIAIGFMAPHADVARVKALRDRKLTAFAMELLPRTTRAQAMDVLSS
ncbi:MAG: NAD(P)(+) transhydrogenase (Re/Si-specific) subunit alpha, partial [Xanthomonadales bacterium]|nr:NAD(P)(+) transhydrogenase (Re/Si-specific) subunit alpha [Xanthomonadales bacterium]